MTTSVPSSILTALLKHGVKNPAHEARIVEAIVKGPRISTMELAKAASVSRRQIWHWVKSGKIPKPRKDGHRFNTWDFSEVSHVL